ncbi:hypothetical protein HQ544_01345 [Candidatus Falkowbacteria bacterium]|nr:hypothetical protein [Candidatus Falkowbacteria bacterium]
MNFFSELGPDQSRVLIVAPRMADRAANPLLPKWSFSSERCEDIMVLGSAVAADGIHVNQVATSSRPDAVATALSFACKNTSGPEGEIVRIITPAALRCVLTDRPDLAEHLSERCPLLGCFLDIALNDAGFPDYLYKRSFDQAVFLWNLRKRPGQTTFVVAHPGLIDLGISRLGNMRAESLAELVESSLADDGMANLGEDGMIELVLNKEDDGMGRTYHSIPALGEEIRQSHGWE